MRRSFFEVPDVEREVGFVEGVSGVRVLSSGSDIDEIHVLTVGSRPPKKVVRDIESILLIRFGVRVDHRRVSIVQAASGQKVTAPSGRLKLLDVKRDEQSIRINLQSGANVLVGECLLASQASAAEAAAWAVLNAIKQLIGSRAGLQLVNLQVGSASERPTVLAIVRFESGDAEEFLVGATLVRDEVVWAAARACLDALNRRLGYLPSAKNSFETATAAAEESRAALSIV
jgi:hypothetical protein